MHGQRSVMIKLPSSKSAGFDGHCIDTIIL